MFLKKNKNKELGITLVELMIGLGIAGMISVGVATYLSQQQRTVKQLKSNLRMTTIARQVQRAISDPKVISFSAGQAGQQGVGPGNIALLNCIKSVSQSLADKTSCTSTDPQKQISFDLILPIKGGAPAYTLAERDQNTIAGHDVGVSPGPALYKMLDGTHCTRSSVTATGGNAAPLKGCNIQVRAFFWATCPGAVPFSGDVLQTTPQAPDFAAPSCPTAQTLHLHYQVSYTGVGEGSYKLLTSNIPDDKVFYEPGTKKPSTAGAITISVSSLPPPTSTPLFCPTNSTMTGVVNGQPVCKCMYPYKAVAGCTGLLGPCACTDVQKTCSPEQRYRGIDTSGNTICCDVKCEWRDVNPAMPGSGCRQGGWVEEIQPVPAAGLTSSCVAVSECKIGKWGGTCTVPVTCTEKHKCCYDYDPSGGSSLSCQNI